MSMRTKLTLGLGFLFVIIFALAIYSSLDIQALSKSADRILKDNYDSLVYCKNMLLALDDMRTAISAKVIGQREVSTNYQFFETGKSTFEKNLSAENGNITEVHESEYVEELNRNYSVFLTLCLRMDAKEGRSSYLSDFTPAYLNARQAVVKINDLNMNAIERKSLSTKHDASNMISSIAALGAGCIVLAFFYFWFFPLYVSSTLSYLENRMLRVLKNIDIKLDTQSKDEAFVLLQSIALLEKRLSSHKN